MSVLRVPHAERQIQRQHQFVYLDRLGEITKKPGIQPTFDIARTPNEHIAFGEGIHFCLGASLARMEGEIAIATMLERFPNLRLAIRDNPPAYRGSYLLRGLKMLPMIAG